MEIKQVLLSVLHSCVVVFVFDRFSHSSVMLPSGLILMYGGFGHQDSNGAHSRLDSLVCVRQAEEEKVFEILDVTVIGEALPGMLLGV